MWLDGTSTQVVLSKFQSTATGEYAIWYGSSRFKFSTYGNSAQYDVTANSFGAPSTGQWYFVVVRHNATAHTNSIQINNGTVDTGTGAAEHADSAGPFVIGGFGSPASLFFTGRVDGVGFWKRLLTTDEATSLYNSGNGQDYPFSSPAAVSDLSAYGDSGQVIMNWTSPDPGGSPITDYIVEYKLNSSSTWLIFDDGISTNTTATVTTLTNGSLYDFRVTTVNAGGNSPVSNTATATPMSLLFQDNFDSRTNGSIDGQNGWVLGGGGTWTIGSGGSGKIVVSGTSGSYTTHYISQGDPSWINQRVKVDFLAGTSQPIIWLRKQDQTGNGDGYLLFGSGGTWYIEKNMSLGSGLVQLASAADPITLTSGNWYTIDFSVTDNSSGSPVLSAYVYAQGGTRPTTPFLTYTDTGETFKEGYVALGTASSTATSYDNFIVDGTTNENLTLIAPSHRVSAASNVATTAIINDNGTVFYIPYIQTSSTLSVKGAVGSTIMLVGGGVKFTLNSGLASEQTSTDMSAPYTATFNNLTKGTYTLAADVVNSSQVVQTGSGKHDEVTQVGIGDIYTIIGDSISAGFYGTNYGTTHYKSWLEAPAGSVSTDNRNYPQYHPVSPAAYHTSFSKDLNNTLASYLGYPVFVMNEGRSGYKASDFQTVVTQVAFKNRQKYLQPNGWLMNLGVNDAFSVPAATFSTRMQSLIDTAISTYSVSASKIYLAQPMFSKEEPRQSTELTYLPIITSLVSTNNAKTGPDFYNFFSNYQSTYYNDTLHPNQAGIVQFARLWNLVMIAPQNVSVSQNGSSAVVTWNSLTSYESSIAGYKVKYGTTSGSYSTTVDVGDVLTKTITGLTSGQTYYFVVSGYDDDPYTTTETQNSSETSLAYNTTAPTISSVSSGTPTSSGATITWTTNEDSSSKVDYGLTNSYGSSTTESDTSVRVSSHSVTLSDLSGNCTTYHYRVRSKDAAGNEVVGTDNTFATSGCPTSNSSQSSSTSSPVCSDTAPGTKASWLYGAIAQDSGSVLLYFTEADNPVNKYVLEYGTKSGDYPYGVQDMGVNSRGQMTFLVKSLSSNTTYYFRVRGGNGCATGTWSNEISTKTKGLVSYNQLDITKSELVPKIIEEAPRAETCQTYMTKSGDTLWSIAKSLLGDGNKYKEIVEQNKDTYSSLETSNNLRSGWELKINCGKQTTTETQKIPETQTQGGYDVKVKVVDINKKPIEGASVTLHSTPQTAKTNDAGIAEFKNVEAGDHKVLIAYNNFEGEQSINLTGDVKEFDLNVTVQQKAISLSPLAYGIIGIMGLVIIGLIVLLIKSKRKE